LVTLPRNPHRPQMILPGFGVRALLRRFETFGATFLFAML
jgi:hypothetical protein